MGQGLSEGEEVASLGSQGARSQSPGPVATTSRGPCLWCSQSLWQLLPLKRAGEHTGQKRGKLSQALPDIRSLHASLSLGLSVVDAKQCAKVPWLHIIWGKPNSKSSFLLRFQLATFAKVNCLQGELNLRRHCHHEPTLACHGAIILRGRKAPLIPRPESPILSVVTARWTRLQAEVVGLENAGPRGESGPCFTATSLRAPLLRRRQ